MILKLIKKLLHHFNYEVVHFAQMASIKRDREKLYSISDGRYKLVYIVDYINGEFIVKTKVGSPVCVTVKTFKVSDYGSIDYARACAKELCDKLNEEPLTE